MIYTSLAVIALSATAAVSPLTRMVHMHPHTTTGDTRVSLTLHNSSPVFHDVRINGRTYTVLPQHSLAVKAPAGTTIYADSSTGSHHRGDVITQMSAQPVQQRVDLN